MYQKGGLDPLLKVPKFKYTFNEERKLFIGSIYPYAEYFLDCITNIPFNSYSYNGTCEYIDKDENENEEIIANCASNGYPLYILSGGSVYEILNKKFPNVNLYNYCDATGDVDVSLYPPKLTTNEEGLIYFLNKNGKINSFYHNFTSWTFENFLKNIKSLENILDKIAPSMVNFDISEYSDIPDKNKTPDTGFKIETVGKLYVVGFLNEDSTMFKIQVVCKIQDSTISVIDHAVEIIIPLPESNPEFSPSADSYSPSTYNTINLLSKNFNVQNYNSLIDSNINAYIERKQVYGASNEREFIHKPINHIARIFYLYELIYKNKDSFQLKLPQLNLLLLFGLRPNKIKQIKNLNYYKIVDDTFHKIFVDTNFFLNSYLELIKKNTYSYNMFSMNNREYFNENVDAEQMHDLFITELFNDNLFEPSELLTFPTPALAGGKKNKTKKNKTKKNKTKKNKTKKNKTKKNKIKKNKIKKPKKNYNEM